MMSSVVEVCETSSRKRRRGSVEQEEEARKIEENEGSLSDTMVVLKNSKPDSVPRIVGELSLLVRYVRQRPNLFDGSASFLRDYIRTLLAKYSREAEKSIEQPNSPNSLLTLSPTTGPDENSDADSQSASTYLPPTVLTRIFSLLDGKDLAVVSKVCKSWEKAGHDPALWKRICVQYWRSLETDDAIWKFMDVKASATDEHRWRKMYHKIKSKPQWRCRLQKTTRFVCNLLVHHIHGNPMPDNLPTTLRVERRFELEHLPMLISQNSPVLYFEPESERDRLGFEDFIQYLVDRKRAGLAPDPNSDANSQIRYIFIPPCSYSRDRRYYGKNLLGVVQVPTWVD